MDLSFWGTISQFFSNPLLAAAILLTLGVILVNGWTYAPNAIAACVVTRCMPLRSAVAMAAIFNFLGVLITSLVNTAVAQTITKMADFGDSPREGTAALAAALLSIVLWSTLAWIFGIPTSESHALIAGLSGGAVALHGSFEGINGGEWIKVIYGLVISVLLGFLLGQVICRLVILIFKRTHRRRTEVFFKYAQIVGAAFSSFMHGAQDGQKFMGVIILCIFMANGLDPAGIRQVNSSELLWLMLLCSAVMGLGTLLGGKKIIKSVGVDMVKLEKYQGFSADLASSLALLAASVFGIPVSTTHAKTAAIMGVGSARRLSAVNLAVVRDMAMTWILTFPGCGLIGFLMTRLFLITFG